MCRAPSAFSRALLLALWLSMAKIARPLNQLAQRMGALAGGDVAVEIDGQNRRDEVGTMARAVQVFKDNAVALKESEAQAETQRRAAEEERARNEALRAEAARQVQRVVTGLGSGLERMARGDLTYRITDEYIDEYKKVREDFNAAIDQLQDTIKNIAQSSSEVSNAASEISASTSDLSQRTEEQAASLEETSASMEQISVTVKKNAENAAQANQFANETAVVADRGGAVVAQAVDAMARIEDSSRKISDIISVIDEIARQTNLLALNAAVEAARAGEAGRGFAVVASEVRSLAQRSSQAAKDIKDLITNSSTQVQEGVELVNKAGASLTEIVESIKRVAQIVADIAVASNEQATGIDQINTALNQMDEVTQQNSALVEENAATAKTLEQQSGAMSESVGAFKLTGHGSREQGRAGGRGGAEARAVRARGGAGQARGRAPRHRPVAGRARGQERAGLEGVLDRTAGRGDRAGVRKRLLRCLLARRRGMDRERVHAAGEFLRQRGVDHAMALDPALPLEGLRHDMHPVMGFAARPAAGVARVLVGFILNVEPHRRERRRELLRNAIAGVHDERITAVMCPGQCCWRRAASNSPKSRLEGSRAPPA